MMKWQPLKTLFTSVLDVIFVDFSKENGNTENLSTVPYESRKVLGSVIAFWKENPAFLCNFIQHDY